MINLNLDPVKLAADIVTVSGLYSYSANPGLTGPTDSHDVYGFHEFFVENDPNAPFINKGVDLGGNYWFQQNPQGVGLGLIIRIGTPPPVGVARIARMSITQLVACDLFVLFTMGGYQVFVYGPRSNPNAQNGWTASDWASTSAVPTACAPVGPMPPPITPKPVHPPPIPMDFPAPTLHPPDPPFPPPPIPTSFPPEPNEPILTDDGGVVGDPHCEGFDRLFDFHGKAEGCYQLYKSKSLLVNCKMRHAYNCQDGGTFIEGIYVKSYQNGKEFEATFANCGTSDTSHVFIPLKQEELSKHLVRHPSMNDFLNEVKHKAWENDFGVLIKTDVGNIYLIQSKYLKQVHINFKFVPSIIENDATGVIGQTRNMRIRLPNESFEIADITSNDVLKIITPEMYTQVII